MRKKQIRKDSIFLSFPELVFNLDQFFFLDHPYQVIELGTGNGVFLTLLAQRYPNRFFWGFDQKKERLWNGCRLAQELNLSNIRFINCKIEDLFPHIPSESIHEIWVQFPDPFPKPSKANRRLVHHQFFVEYQRILVNGGVFHFKTDSQPLFKFARETLTDFPLMPFDLEIEDLSDSSAGVDSQWDYMIPTHYEMIWRRQERIISYLRAIKGCD